jgi:hypothetical protein
MTYDLGKANCSSAQASPQLKLIPLYLMDSIVKNVGGSYSNLFMANLTHTFYDAFSVADNKTRQSMIKLLDTWQTQSVFSQQKNNEIRLRLAAILTAETNSERANVPVPVIPQPVRATCVCKFVYSNFRTDCHLYICDKR